ncbi:hypothetical protein [Bacteroides sedimenti]
MNKLLTTLFVFFLSLASMAQNPVNRLGIKENLEFNKMDYKLSWSAKPNENYLIQEYLPKGENFESFNQMLTIHLFITDINAEGAVNQKVNELIARRKTDPICNYQVTKSPDGKEYLVDFLLSESKDSMLTVVEFNLYRYKQIEIPKRGKALFVYAYSKRGYGNDITAFFKALDNDRISYLKEMISTNIPNVTIENK